LSIGPALISDFAGILVFMSTVFPSS